MSDRRERRERTGGGRNRENSEITENKTEVKSEVKEVTEKRERKERKKEAKTDVLEDIDEDKDLKEGWVPDEEKGFVRAEVIDRDGDSFTAICEGESKEKKFKISECFPLNPSKLDKLEDMSKLSYSNEPAVLHNLNLRYQDDLIYTYSGLFLVAVNPYKNVPIYTNKEGDLYKQGRGREDVPPHVFQVAEEAYRNMVTNQQDQSMLVTGESGAGKTVFFILTLRKTQKKLFNI
jgi:myosin heavy subunit